MPKFFQKIRKENGKREVYLLGKKVCEYVNRIKFAEFVEKKIQTLTKNSSLNFNYDIVRGGGGGFYAFEFLLNRAYVAHKYHKIFYDFYLRHQRGEKLVFIDGGVHNGVFADVALACGGVVHGFEPNVYLCAFLRTLYKDEPRFVLHENAISTANEKVFFHNTFDDVVSQSGSIVEFSDPKIQPENDGYEVQMIDFAAFLKEIYEKHGKIALIKLDIEGAEFAVLDALLEQNLHECAEFIMVETHERVFENPQKVIGDLKAKLEAKGAGNVFLDWV